MTIAELIQPIRSNQHYAVCEDLFRSGKIPSYWVPDKEYTKRQRISFREIHQYPVIEVPVNLNSLRDKIIQLIHLGFGAQIRLSMSHDMWDETEFIEKEYEDKILQLATAVVLAIRDRLFLLAIKRKVTQNQVVESPWYHRNEYPSGICSIIKQFGYCETKSTHGNPS